MALRIVFFGTSEFAVPTLSEIVGQGYQVVAVYTQPPRAAGRGLRQRRSPVHEVAEQFGLRVVAPASLKSAGEVERFAEFEPDVGVVAAYGRIIPAHLLSVPRLGMINVHASLLPKYRGAAPVHRAVMNGDRQTGVTIMRVIQELDAGPMLAKLARPIGPDETSEVVEEALAELGANLLVTVVDHMAEGTAREEPQDDTQATYAPRLTKEEGLIDWSQAAAAMHNRVRGLHPWPHAYTYLRGTRLIIRRTRLIADLEGPRRADEGPRRSEGGQRRATEFTAGSIVGVSPDAIHVETGNGRIAVVEIQPEGRRAMRVHDFVLGHPVAPGEVFSQS